MEKGEGIIRIIHDVNELRKYTPRPGDVYLGNDILTGEQLTLIGDCVKLASLTYAEWLFDSRKDKSESASYEHIIKYLKGSKLIHLDKATESVFINGGLSESNAFSSMSMRQFAPDPDSLIDEFTQWVNFINSQWTAVVTKSALAVDIRLDEFLENNTLLRSQHWGKDGNSVESCSFASLYVKSGFNYSQIFVGIGDGKTIGDRPLVLYNDSMRPGLPVIVCAMEPGKGWEISACEHVTDPSKMIGLEYDFYPYLIKHKEYPDTHYIEYNGLDETDVNRCVGVPLFIAETIMLNVTMEKDKNPYITLVSFNQHTPAYTVLEVGQIT